MNATERRQVTAALRKCTAAFNGILTPLDDEERKQPVYRACERASDSAEKMYQ